MIRIACLFLAAAGLRSADAGVFKQTVFESGAEGYNIYRIPTMVQAANGDLLAFAEARSGGDASEIDVVMKRSTDNGKTWGPLSVAVENDNYRGWDGLPETNVTAGNQSPVVDLLDPVHPGRIWMPFTVENDRVFVTYSDNHGLTWKTDAHGRAREITSDVKPAAWGDNWYATGPVHGIQLTRGANSGRLVIPSDHKDASGNNGAQVVYSDDHGATWAIGAIHTDPGAGVNKPNENVAVELVDGRIYFNSRDSGSAAGKRSIAYSSDGGLTYDGAGFIAEPNIATPVVQNSAIRFHATDQGDAENVLVYSSPGDIGSRTDMTILLSFDEGTTWTKDTLIHSGPSAYSDLVKINPETVGVLYEAGETLYDEIIFGYFEVEDLAPDAWNGIVGDVNQDGVLNQADVDHYVEVWTPITNEFYLGGADNYTNGDLDFDGDNDLHDAFAMRAAVLSAGLSAEPIEELLHPVPEPSACALIVLATTGCLFIPRRNHIASR